MQVVAIAHLERSCCCVLTAVSFPLPQVSLRRETLVAQAVAALSALTGNIDVSVGEVNEMLERHSGHPEKSVQQVTFLLSLLLLSLSSPSPPFCSSLLHPPHPGRE